MGVTARARVHYGVVVVGATFLVMLIAAGFRATPGVLIKPLHDHFGWSTATIGGAVSVNLLCYGLGVPFAAAIVERYGIRRVCASALAVVAAGAALTTQMTQAWQLYVLWGVVIGTATGAIAMPLAAIVANRWFSRRRGVVTGLLSASNASGQLVFLPVLAVLVTHYGWRAAAAAVAIVAVLVVIPIALVFLRHDPSDVGLRPYGAEPDEPPFRPAPSPLRGAIDAIRIASRKRDFWLLAGAFFVCGATTNGLIGTHLITACTDHGISEVKGAGLLAAIGIFDIVGTLASGWLTDRYDPRRLLFWYYGLRGLSLLGLNAALSHAGLTLGAFVVFYGLDWVATVPPTVALTREVFGRERGGVVFAWIFAAHQLGAASAAWGAGLSRTYLHSYTPAFMIAGSLGIGAAVVSLLIGRRVIWRVRPAGAT
jgi:MFS family permease